MRNNSNNSIFANSLIINNNIFSEHSNKANVGETLFLIQENEFLIGNRCMLY